MIKQPSNRKTFQTAGIVSLGQIELLVELTITSGGVEQNFSVASLQSFSAVWGQRSHILFPTPATCRCGFCYMELDHVPAGLYNLVPTTFLPKQEGPFFLDFFSTFTLKVSQLQ